MAVSYGLSFVPKTQTPKILNSLRSNPKPKPTSKISFFFKPHNPISKPSSLSTLFIPPKPLRLSTLFKPPKPLRPTAEKAPIQSLFTGIVEEMGHVAHLGPSESGGFDMTVSASTVLGGVNLGDSIAINGTCLTVTHFDHAASQFTVGLAPETLRRTSLAELGIGSPVNLERAVTPATRMGGHFVQGHVDGTGEIVAMVAEEDSMWVRVKAAKEILKYVVPKGFIAVDGTSLTVVDVFDDDQSFNFMLVAYTQQKVVIPLKKVGQKVNLEVDILGKYVERILGSGFAKSS